MATGLNSTAESNSDTDSSGVKISGDELHQQLEMVKALSAETRLRTLHVIAGSDDEVCVCEIEPRLEVSQGAVSHALARLTEAGLLERRKDGRWRYYTCTRDGEKLLTAVESITGDHNG